MVSWNTEFWDQDWITGGRLDADDLYRYLRSLDADVYLLHEYLHLNDAATDIHAKAVRIDEVPRLRREFPGYQLAVAGEQLTRRTNRTSPAMRMRRLLPEGLVDNTRALESIYPGTWRADGTPLWRIDWLLTTSQVAVHRYEMLDPAGLSDHRAQRAVRSLSG